MARQICARMTVGLDEKSRQKKRRGFPRLSMLSGFSAAYGIVIAAPELSYQYSFSVAGKPVGDVVVNFAYP